KNHDALEDLTFQFRFQNALAASGNGIALPIGDDAGTKNVAIPLVIAGQVTGDAGTTDNINVNETYRVKVVTGNRRTGTAPDVTNANGGSTPFKKPIDNIGSKTFPNNSYAAYSDQFHYTVNIPGCGQPAKMFVGQRREPFAVNLGTIFDLINADGATITDPGLRGAVANPIGNKNITTI